MKHKIIIVAVFLMGGTSLFAQTQEPAQTEPKAEVKTTKPAKTGGVKSEEAKPLTRVRSAQTSEARKQPAKKDQVIIGNPSF